MIIRTPRFVLRDFREQDRASFLAYHRDPRYRRLYDLEDSDDACAQALFDLFLAWSEASPRENYQLGIFDAQSGRLCGCAGLRCAGASAGSGVLGIELTPDDWGRYRLALDVAAALIEFGFRGLELASITGDTASGNRRVEKLARWFGAKIVDRRDGPAWMAARGWSEVSWTLSRERWARGELRSRAHERQSLPRPEAGLRAGPRPGSPFRT